MLKTLTTKQKNILDFYKKFFSEYWIMPTYAQASEILKTSPSVIHTHIANLEKIWYLAKDGSGKIMFDPKLKLLPVLWSIACWNPIEIFDEKEEEIEVPLSMIWSYSNGYILKARWSSMEAEKWGICDWDFLVIKSQNDVDDWEIAVVVDKWDFDEKATLKQVFKKSNSLVLKAKNPAFPTTLLQDCEIRGKLVWVIRKF